MDARRAGRYQASVAAAEARDLGCEKRRAGGAEEEPHGHHAAGLPEDKGHHAPRLGPEG